MASLLIIGGSGFFGKSILDSYLRGLLNPWNIDFIFILSRNSSKLKTDTPELINSSIAFIDADITTCTTLPFADFVIHAAATTDIGNYLDRPLEEQRNIQRGTYNYCELAKKFHRKSKILYVSSGAVYGKQPASLVAIPEDYNPGPEELMDKGKMHYASAKRDSEKAIKKLSEAGLDVSIARCFAFVGKYLPRNQHFAIGNFIENIIKNQPIEVKAKRRVCRTYMAADDLVRWLMTIVFFSNTSCPIFNVGSNEIIYLDELAQALAKIYGTSVSIAPLDNLDEDRYVPSINRAQEILGLEVFENTITAIDRVVSTLKIIEN